MSDDERLVWLLGDMMNAVENIFCSVIETFAFAFPEECSDPDADPGDDIVRADIAFRGAVVGSLSIAAPAGLCNEMAANILGVEADDQEALRRGPDTLAELANITAGHLCTQLDPNRTTYLEPPVAARMEPNAWAGLTESEHCRRFTVEDHVLALQLRVRTPIQAAS